MAEAPTFDGRDFTVIPRDDRTPHDFGEILTEPDTLPYNLDKAALGAVARLDHTDPHVVKRALRQVEIIMKSHVTNPRKSSFETKELWKRVLHNGSQLVEQRGNVVDVLAFQARVDAWVPFIETNYPSSPLDLVVDPSSDRFYREALERAMPSSTPVQALS